MTETMNLTRVKLPSKHVMDWWSRCDDGEMGRYVSHTARTVTFDLTEAGLTDLISDAEYYAECMGPDDTGDEDYRPAARACLRGLKRAGVDVAVFKQRQREQRRALAQAWLDKNGSK